MAENFLTASGGDARQLEGRRIPRNRTVGALRAEAAARFQSSGMPAGDFGAELQAAQGRVPPPHPQKVDASSPRKERGANMGLRGDGKPGTRSDGRTLLVGAQPGRGLLSTDILQKLSETRTEEAVARSAYPSSDRVSLAVGTYRKIQQAVIEATGRTRQNLLPALQRV